MAHATRSTNPASATTRSCRRARVTTASAAVALLVLQPRSAPAGVVPADLRPGRRVSRPGLLAGAERRDPRRPGRARDARTRERAHAPPRCRAAGAGAARAVRGARACSDRHRAARLLARTLHGEWARRRRWR